VCPEVIHKALSVLDAPTVVQSTAEQLNEAETQLAALQKLSLDGFREAADKLNACLDQLREYDEVVLQS
jgi:hypothetical protein